MNKDKPLSKARFWLLLLLLGFAGQLAWAVENQYINLWVFSQSHNAAHITWMTASSSIVATVTTFLIGALSDRLGKRRIFISLGYTIWGVFVFGFAIMSLSNMLTLSNGDMALALILVGVFNCIIDCLMTFFGSSANDACFNAWVTDNTDEHTRPLVESVLSVLPLIATALMVVLGGSLADGTGHGDHLARTQVKENLHLGSQHLAVFSELDKLGLIGLGPGAAENNIRVDIL